VLAYDGPGRHPNDGVAAVPAVRAATRAASTGLRAHVATADEVGEGRHPTLGDEHDVSTPPAIPAIRPAAGDVRLTPEGGGPVAAGPGGRSDAGTIGEHGG
jgi:hypothetical protein